MPKMVSKVDHVYGGVQYRVGDTFEADPKFVQLMTVIGRAELVNDSPIAESSSYQRRDMTAESNKRKSTKQRAAQ
jgi:hypothetical protein